MYQSLREYHKLQSSCSQLICVVIEKQEETRMIQKRLEEKLNDASQLLQDFETQGKRLEFINSKLNKLNK